MMERNIIETKNLHYEYDDGTYALSGVNLGIRKGKITAVLGGNGAGKSTLFLNLNGILRPSLGDVIFKGKPVSYSRSGLREIRKSVGIVFQDPDNQLFSASVYQDISFGAMNLKLPEDEVQRRVELALKRTGIEHLKSKPTHCLSHGQKKRVALAGILVMEPEVLVLDEPTAGLDPVGVSEIMKLLKELQKELEPTIVISTHDIDIIPLFCDYTYVMADGKIVLEGTPEEVFNKACEMRGYNLRLPRIGHLMEILIKKDGFELEEMAYTISKARNVLKKFIHKVSKSKKVDSFMVNSGRELRIGYTTGSCAAAAAKAGAIMLFEKHKVNKVQLVLPDGREIGLPIEDIVMDGGMVSCCVVKDAGDDPDATDGIKIYARVSKKEGDIIIDGGIGVGRVTGIGLPCEIGEAAINPVPKKMIEKALLKVADLYGYKDGFEVEIYVPDGKEIAKKTFNERLGITGGISILGTTGIVEPMSESSLIETIKLEIGIKKKNGQNVSFLSPGNYGLEFARVQLELDIDDAVKCSNYIGEALDYALYLGFEKLLLVGHIGKLVKIAAGIMNTHSKIADCRNEIFTAHCALEGANKKTIEKIMNARTTNEIHDILVSGNLSYKVYRRILQKIEFQLNYRVMKKMQIGVVVFSNENGVLMQTDNAEALINELKGKKL